MPSESTPTTTAAIRAQLLDRLRAPAMAWSVNGRDVQFQAGFDLEVEPGGFLDVTTPAGERCLVHVHEMVSGTRPGISVDLGASEIGLDDHVVRSATATLQPRIVDGTGTVLGRLDGSKRALGGFTDAEIAPADDATISAYFDGSLGATGGLEIGTLRCADVPARLRPQGFARHTFMVGQSGSGKTFSLGVVLERLLLETDLPVVIIDPNSDYVNLGTLTSRATINRFRRPAMTRDEYDALAERYRRRVEVVVASAHGGDLPLRIHLSDLTIEEQALTMQLDPIDDPDEYHALLEVTRSLAAGPYDVGMVEAALRDRFDDASRMLAQRIANLGIASWSVWAAADEPSLVGLGAGHRAIVLDTGSLADARERSVAALALLGRLRRRPQKVPVSIVIDEAHNVCPPDARAPLERAVADLTVWIAGEGRKYGLYLLLSSQRPQKLHPNVLSQCDNLLLMRVNSSGDLAELKRAFSHVPPSLVDEARTHRMGEMLAAGPIAPTPLRLQVGVRWTKEGGGDLPTDWSSVTD